jgi:fructose-1,6-bisphosphatase/inositol monophosphatase family enzyme
LIIFVTLSKVVLLEFFLKRGTKRWDICPGDALLKSVGGKLTNKFGQPYAYTIEKDTWMCSEGLIASLSPETHDKVIERLNS